MADLRFLLASPDAQAAYAVLHFRRAELPLVEGIHTPEVIAAQVLHCSTEQAAERLAELRRVGLLGEGLDLLVGTGRRAPARRRAQRPASATDEREAPRAQAPSSDSLRERLRASKRTITELAHETGIARSSLSAFASGKLAFGDERRATLAAALVSPRGVTVTIDGDAYGDTRSDTDGDAGGDSHGDSDSDTPPSDSPLQKLRSSEAQNSQTLREVREERESQKRGVTVTVTGGVTTHGDSDSDRRSDGDTAPRMSVERWQECEAALSTGGEAVDLRGSTELKLKLKRLLEQGGYGPRDCAALAAYAKARPPTYPKWLRERGTLALTSLVRAFEVEGDVLAGLMSSASTWDRQQREKAAARRAYAEQASKRPATREEIARLRAELWDKPREEAMRKEREQRAAQSHSVEVARAS
jgi:hypothetical protein